MSGSRSRGRERWRGWVFETRAGTGRGLQTESHGRAGNNGAAVSTQRAWLAGGVCGEHSSCDTSQTTPLRCAPFSFDAVGVCHPAAAVSPSSDPGQPAANRCPLDRRWLCAALPHVDTHTHCSIARIDSDTSSASSTGSEQQRQHWAQTVAPLGTAATVTADSTAAQLPCSTISSSHRSRTRLSMPTHQHCRLASRPRHSRPAATRRHSEA